MKSTIFITNLVTAVCSILVFAIVSVAHASAANYTFTTTRTYTIAPGGNGSEVEVRTVVSYIKGPGYYLPSPTATFSLALADPQTPESELEAQRQSLKITDAKGRSISFSASKKGRSYQITATYPDAISSGQSYTIIARYTNNEAAYRLGATVHLSIGGYTKDTAFRGEQNGNTYQINEKVIIKGKKNDIGSALVTVLYPNPVKSAPNGDVHVYEWDAQSLLGQSIGMVAGAEQIFRFEFRNKAVATQQQETLGSKLLKNTYKISVPYDLPEVGQSVVFDYINPLPDQVEVSSVGSWKVPYFVYYVAPTDEKDILISGYIKTTKPYTTSQLQTAKISQIPATLVEQYTKPEQYWETEDVQIVTAAQQLKSQAKADSLYDLVKQDYNYVISQLTYDQSKIATRESNIRFGAVEALKRKSGVCMEFADLMVAILRAQGIPAIAANGAGYSRYDKPENFIGHQWVMVYFSTVGWVPVDPTWGDSGGELIGPDLLHAYFGMMPDGQSRDSFLVSYLGWDSGFALTLPSVFVSATPTIPPVSIAQLSSDGASLEQLFKIFPTTDVAQGVSKKDVFAGHPYQTISDVQQAVQARAQSGSIVDKVENQLTQLQTSAWGKILVDRAPLIGIGILIIIIAIIVYFMARRRSMTL